MVPADPGRRAWAIRWGPWAALAALALAVTWPVTFGGRLLFWGVVGYQFLPWYEAAAALWRAGALPLWNTWLGGGAPLLANYQVAALYPPNWVMLVIPPERALGWLVAAHLLLAGAGTYVWARARGHSRSAALVGALALEGCGYLVTRAGLFPSIVFAAAWIPVWLWRAERLAQIPDARRAARLAAVVGLGLLAGHAQSAVYGLLVVGLLLLWRGATAPQSRLSVWLWGGLSLALGGLLAAMQLLPTAAYWQVTARSGGLTEEALTYSFWPWRLLTFFAPDLFGHPARGDFWGYATYWEDAGYVGLIPLLLALGWLLRPARGHRREAWFWGLLGGIALTLALGQNLPGYQAAFQALPLLRLFNAPARRLLVTELALAALTAPAVEAWLDRRPQRWQALTLVIGLSVAGGGWVALQTLPGRGVTFGAATLRAGLLLIAWGGLALLRGRWPRAALATALAVLVWLDLAWWGRTLLPAIGPEFYATCRAPALAALWRQEPDAGRTLFAGTRTGGTEYEVRFRYFRFNDWRPLGGSWAEVCETLLPNGGILARVPAAENEDPFRLARWEELELLAMAHPRLLPLLGVTHRLDTACAASEVDVGAMGGVHLCRVGAAPRAWIVPQARQVAVTDMSAALSDPAFDFRREVLVEGAPSLSAAGGQGTVASVVDGPNTVTLSLTTDGPAYLVLADAWEAGWRAELDGAPVAVLRADLALRAVAVPAAGQHRLVMRYRPPTLYAGAALTGLAVLAILALELRGQGRLFWE